MKKIIGIIAITTFLSGCASITGDTTQSIRIETLNEKGELIAGADCSAKNEYGSFPGKSSDNILVRRSSENLFIDCVKEGYPNASAQAVSRANGGMFGNILFGGGVGAIIDHNKGTAYTYPQWMKLVFGKVIVFDRGDDKDGEPSFAKLPSSQEPTQALVVEYNK